METFLPNFLNFFVIIQIQIHIQLYFFLLEEYTF